MSNSDVIDIESFYPLDFNCGSVMAVYLEMKVSDDPQTAVLSRGTGFIVRTNDQNTKFFLVTARHNFTGQDHFSGKWLSSRYHMSPVVVIVYLPNHQKLVWRPFSVSLLNEQRVPLWLEHPIFQSNVDVVAIELQSQWFQDGWGFCFPDLVGSRGENLEVSMPVDIIGFPLEKKAEYVAVWVKGYVASDPNLSTSLIDPTTRLPCFIISARTWGGQSGSPVCFFDFPKNLAKNGTYWAPPANAKINLPHLYSGRLNPPDKEKDSSDIGIVWKDQVVWEVVHQAKYKVKSLF